MKLDKGCNISETLFKPSAIARVYPKDPRIRKELFGTIRVFDGKLRFTLMISLYSTSSGDVYNYPTPPRPTSAVRDPGRPQLCAIFSSMSPRSTKSPSRLNGIKIEGFGGVSGRSGLIVNTKA